MRAAGIKGWQGIQEEILRRITAQEWRPGQLIPTEIDLAREFNCARATVNRALRNLASSGIVERKRKADTRIAMLPIRRATLAIPIMRHEIERKGGGYGYKLLVRSCDIRSCTASRWLRAPADTAFLHLQAVHLADGMPYAFEDRWINLETLPRARSVDFAQVSANEWLVGNVPFEAGDISFSAVDASRDEAMALQCEEGQALFMIERTTRSARGSITAVRIVFAPGHQIHTEI